MQQICLTPTSGSELSAKVKVVAVGQALSHAVSGLSSMELRWSTAIVGQSAARQVGGMVDLPETPLLEPLSAVGQVRFDDCILVFPTGSGLEPLYLMYKRGRGVPA